jgi:UDP-N-acetylmuramyl pentapeptide synthase
MIPLTVAEIASITGGTIADEAAAATSVTGPVVIDSRQAGPGALFAALPGEQADGHDYAAAAAGKGAAAILAARPLPAAGAPVIVVADVTVALGLLARAVLGRLPEATVVGITGSSGKTSTKDLTAQVVERLGATIAPEGSLNNEIGLPLTVLRADETTRYLVLEMAARGIGHIAYLTGIAPPKIGAVLNVGHAHAGEFGSIDAVAKAKGELVEALPAAGAGGVAVLNADDPNVAAMAARTGARVVTTSVDPARDADFKATGVALDDLGRASFTLHARGVSAPVTLTLHGGHRGRAQRRDRPQQETHGVARASRRGARGERRVQRQPGFHQSRHRRPGAPHEQRQARAHRPRLHGGARRLRGREPRGSRPARRAGRRGGRRRRRRRRRARARRGARDRRLAGRGARRARPGRRRGGGA